MEGPGHGGQGGGWVTAHVLETWRCRESKGLEAAEPKSLLSALSFQGSGVCCLPPGSSQRLGGGHHQGSGLAGRREARPGSGKVPGRRGNR